MGSACRPPTSEQLLSPVVVAKLCGVSRSTVRRWMVDGTLPCVVTPGGWRRIEAHALVGFMRRHSMPVPTALDVSGRAVMIACRQKSMAARLRTALLRFAVGADIVTTHEEVGVGVLLAAHRPAVAIVCFPIEQLRDLGVYRQILGHCVRHGAQVVVLDQGFGETEREVLLGFGAAAVAEVTEDLGTVVRTVAGLLAGSVPSRTGLGRQDS